jgi:hypothetical protein
MALDPTSQFHLYNLGMSNRSHAGRTSLEMDCHNKQNKDVDKHDVVGCTKHCHVPLKFTLPEDLELTCVSSHINTPSTTPTY